MEVADKNPNEESSSSSTSASGVDYDSVRGFNPQVAAGLSLSQLALANLFNPARRLSIELDRRAARSQRSASQPLSPAASEVVSPPKKRGRPRKVDVAAPAGPAASSASASTSSTAFSPSSNAFSPSSNAFSPSPAAGGSCVLCRAELSSFAGIGPVCAGKVSAWALRSSTFVHEHSSRRIDDGRDAGGSFKPVKLKLVEGGAEFCAHVLGETAGDYIVLDVSGANALAERRGSAEPHRAASLVRLVGSRETSVVDSYE